MTTSTDFCIGDACPVCNPQISPRGGDQPPRPEGSTTHKEDR